MQPYDVTSSFVQIVDAGRAGAEEVLLRIDPMRSLANRLSALGFDDRAMWSQSEELGNSLIWRFDAGGTRARLNWQLGVEMDAAGRTVLTVRLGARGNGEEARRRTLASWTLLEELARNHARRLARAIDDYASADRYDVAAPQLRAAI